MYAWIQTLNINRKRTAMTNECPWKEPVEPKIHATFKFRNVYGKISTDVFLLYCATLNVLHVFVCYSNGALFTYINEPNTNCGGCDDSKESDK